MKENTQKRMRNLYGQNPHKKQERNIVLVNGLVYVNLRVEEGGDISEYTNDFRHTVADLSGIPIDAFRGLRYVPTNDSERITFAFLGGLCGVTFMQLEIDESHVVFVNPCS